jgi:hypothetical protein
VLSVHGAALSYLLAPMVWLGWGDLDHLTLLRAVCAALSALAIFLTYRLGLVVTLSPAAALFAAALIALDPFSLKWLPLLRMYALQQGLTLIVVWLYVRVAAGAADETAPGPRRRWELGGLVIAFWLAVFAHLGSALLLPGLAVATLFLHRSSGGVRRDLAAVVALCVPAPLVVLAASSAWGATATLHTPPVAGAPAVSFVGDQHLDLTHLLRPDLTPWTELVPAGFLAGVVPGLAAALSGLIVGAILLRGADGALARARRDTIVTVLVLYWTPVLVLAMAGNAAHGRYLLFVQPLGAILIALVAALLWRERRSWLARVAAVAVVLLLLANTADGLRAFDWTKRANGDPTAALRYVAAHQAPGELVLVDWPPLASLIVPDQAGIRFVIDEAWKVGRYTRPAADGDARDIWLGNPVVASLSGQCAVLAAHPDAWLIGRSSRRNGPMPPSGLERAAARGAITEVFRPDAGVPVYRVGQPAAWQKHTARWCRAPDGDAKASPQTKRERQRGHAPSTTGNGQTAD